MSFWRPVACLMLVFAVLLHAPAAVAQPLILDTFDDLSYTTSVALAGEAVSLYSSSEHSEGASSLLVDYDYLPGGVYTKDARITRTFPAPVDLSGLASLAFDMSVVTPHAQMTLIFVLIDSAGNETRIVLSNALASAATLKTWLFSNSALEKSRWASGGRAFNLREVSKIAFRLQNNADFTAAGSVMFRLDNLRVVNQSNLQQAIWSEDFASYADTAAVAAAWQPATAGVTAELDTASGAALRVRADVSARWTNYLVARTLAAPVDVTAMTHLGVRVKGDTRLAALAPLAKVFLEDTSGNRIIAMVPTWAGIDRWSDLYLPLQRDGIESFTAASTLSMGGASCWRQDTYDAGGWSVDADLTRISRVLVGVETQATGAYPVAGATLLFDDIRFATPAAVDTPAALSAALESASAGALMSLGFGSGVFGNGTFLNQAPNMMQDVAGTLVYSDDPESVLQSGILYRSLLPTGRSRTYVYHTNETAAAAKITAVLQNAGAADAHVTFHRRAFPTPSGNYVQVGKNALQQYYSTTAPPASLTIAPGAAALLDAPMDSTSVARYALLHTIHEFTSDQPLTFTSVLLPAATNTLAAFPGLVFSPDDTHKREGTFTTLGRANATPYAYDTAGGIGRVRVADWGTSVDPFVEGVDAETGAASRLLGNYGVTYNIRVALSSSDGRSLAVMFAPPDNSCGYGTYTRWQYPDTGAVGTGLFVPTSGTAQPGQAGLMCKVSPGTTPQVLRIDTIPAGSMCLPFDILLVPYGAATSDVAGWEVY